MPDGCASADDLHRTITVAADCVAVSKIDRYTGSAARVDDRVGASPTIQIVLTGAADDCVVAGFAIQDVAIVAAIQDVIAAPAIKVISAAAAPEMICSGRADEAVDAIIGANQVFDAVESVTRSGAAAGDIRGE